MNRAKKEPYDFTEDFERALVALVCSRPRVYARIGEEVDPECVNAPAARLALRAARSIAQDTGRGPTSLLLVIQRLRRWMGDGKITQADVEGVADLFDAAEDAQLPAEDALIAEVAPILKRRLEREAVLESIAELQKSGDPTRALRKLDRAARVGQSSESRGTLFGPQAWQQIAAVRHLARVPTGIQELDDALQGGPPRGSCNVWLAATGGGKSMGLIQNAATAALCALNTVYWSLELPEHVISARLAANLSGELVDDMLDPDSEGYARGSANIDARIAAGQLGRVFVCKYTPKATTIFDLRDATHAWEQEMGVRADVVVVDYADKLASTGKGTKDKDGSTYHSAGDIYEDFRIWMEQEGRWGWTASQAGRSKDKGSRMLDVDDVADSMNKVRVADLVLSLNARDEQLVLFVAKNRHGQARQKIGPLPTAFEMGRLSALVATSPQLAGFTP